MSETRWRVLRLLAGRRLHLMAYRHQRVANPAGLWSVCYPRLPLLGCHVAYSADGGQTWRDVPPGLDLERMMTAGTPQAAQAVLHCQGGAG